VEVLVHGGTDLNIQESTASQFVSENVYKTVHKEQQNLMPFLRASDDDSNLATLLVFVQAGASLNIQDRAGLRTA